MRYLAVKVVSDLPNRYRLTRPALPGDRTEPSKHVVLVLDEVDFTPVVTVQAGLFGFLTTNYHSITVEQARRN